MRRRLMVSAIAILIAAPAFAEERQAVKADGITVWSSASYSRVKNSNARTAYTGDTYSGTVGGDYALLPDLTVGSAVTANGGHIRSDVSDSDTDVVGWMVMPYANYKIQPWLAFNLMAGMGQDSDSQTRNGTIKSDYTVSKWMAQGRLTGTIPVANLILSPHLGFLHLETSQGDFVESNGNQVQGQKTALSRGEAGLKLSYVAGSFVPHVGATYLHDFASHHPSFSATATGNLPADNKDAMRAQLGLLYAYSPTIFGNLELATEEFRKDYSNRSATASLILRF